MLYRKEGIGDTFAGHHTAFPFFILFPGDLKIAVPLYLLPPRPAFPADHYFITPLHAVSTKASHGTGKLYLSCQYCHSGLFTRKI
jgi:hypothetical protein